MSPNTNGHIGLEQVCLPTELKCHLVFVFAVVLLRSNYGFKKCKRKMQSKVKFSEPSQMDLQHFKARGEWLPFGKTKLKWTHWVLNPGPSAREADVIPLHHVPDGNNDGQCSLVFHQNCLCRRCHSLIEAAGGIVYVFHRNGHTGI